MIALASGAVFAISGCADLRSYCRRTSHGSTVHAICPETCGLCTAPCADDDARAIALASGAGQAICGCADLQCHCQRMSHGSTVQAICPATCGTCTAQGQKLADEKGPSAHGLVVWIKELTAPPMSKRNWIDEPRAVAPPTSAPAAEARQKSEEFSTSGADLFCP
ncbi:unnamed protein product [Prorocentrum cordatum]|uniref:ShKT domain-containing protein n=1 Tax=Prorocentrum cordatum TaxID=2364126 RepID=A0ABN9RM62_9DINO|nr:unnamed protein product [Polarella glacialis]